LRLWKNISIFIILLLAIFMLVIIDLVTGSVDIPLQDILDFLFSKSRFQDSSYIIITQLRIPRIITAIFAGAALSVSGLQMQTIFRNPLAGPFVLGISSGASLGVALLILGGGAFLTTYLSVSIQDWAIILSACTGAGLVLILLLVISFKVRDVITLLILGIMFGSAVSSVVSIMQFFGDASQLKVYVIWTMGSLSALSQRQLIIFMIILVTGLFIALLIIKKMNVLLIGEQYARSLGVNIKQTRILIFISTSLLAGSVTAFCGPIGFIGIAVPHITRMLFKTMNMHVLLPGTIFTGSVVLLLSDIISQLPGYEQTIPINSVTSLIGIPVVIWIILKNQKMS
jgi:iron complex transport system permease protein